MLVVDDVVFALLMMCGCTMEGSTGCSTVTDLRLFQVPPFLPYFPWFLLSCWGPGGRNSHSQGDARLADLEREGERSPYGAY